jgi:hypothetical protein
MSQNGSIRRSEEESRDAYRRREVGDILKLKQLPPVNSRISIVLNMGN